MRMPLIVPVSRVSTVRVFVSASGRRQRQRLLTIVTFFSVINNNPRHLLKPLLPRANNDHYNLRKYSFLIHGLLSLVLTLLDLFTSLSFVSTHLHLIQAPTHFLVGFILQKFLICSTFISTLTQLQSMLLLILPISYHFIFQFIHLIYVSLEQKVKVRFILFNYV
jgi:hypothetical protein